MERHDNELKKIEKGDKEAIEKYRSNYCLQHCPKSKCVGTCGVTIDQETKKHIGPHTCWACTHSWGH